MSDFLFSSRRRPEGVLRGTLLHYLSEVTADCEERHGDWGSLAVARASHDSDPVLEEDGFLSVLIGDPIVRAPGARAGLAREPSRRRTVHDLLRERRTEGWDDLVDGPFAALGVDLEGGDGLLVSDLSAFLTTFAAENGGDLVLGTHVDAVATAAERSGDLDPVSAADLLLNLSCTFPHTLYRGVEQVGPARVRQFGAGGWTGKETVYWQPIERDVYRSLDEAADALRSALVDGLRDACTGLPLVGLLLSGGEDSRAVLGAIPSGVPVRAFTYADWENREVRISRRIAEKYGAEFVFGERSPTHDLDEFPHVAALVGSASIFVSAHGFGFHERLGLRDVPLVLGGLSSDTLLKSLYSTGESGVGRPYEPGDLPLIRPELIRELAERRTNFRRWLGAMRPDSVHEWEKIWPYPMLKIAANWHGNRRMFASHEPFHSNAVMKLAADVPAAWKSRRALFHRAMRPFLRPAWNVPHTKWHYPYFGRYPNLALSPALRATRGVHAFFTGQIGTPQGSWPKWQRIVALPEMASLKRQNPIAGTPLAEIFTTADADEIDRVTSQEWSPHQKLLLLQLAYLSRLSSVG